MSMNQREKDIYGIYGLFRPLMQWVHFVLKTMKNWSTIWICFRETIKNEKKKDVDSPVMVD